MLFVRFKYFISSSKSKEVIISLSTLKRILFSNDKALFDKKIKKIIKIFLYILFISTGLFFVHILLKEIKLQ